MLLISHGWVNGHSKMNKVLLHFEHGFITRFVAR